MVIRRLSRFHYSLTIQKIFKISNSIPPTEYDLVSPGLWENLARFASVFKHLSVLPLTFSVTERKAYFVQKSFLKRAILKFPAIIWMVATTMLILYLVTQLLSPSVEMDNDTAQHRMRICVKFYVIFIGLLFSPGVYMIGFRPEEIAQIINSIVKFQSIIQGNVQSGNFEGIKTA